jgi:hypothetical protein
MRLWRLGWHTLEYTGILPVSFNYMLRKAVRFHNRQARSNIGLLRAILLFEFGKSEEELDEKSRRSH